jgi:predicted acylesterase/phospholipase RssA
MAVVLGGGGAFGIAFHLGIAHALADAGMPVHHSPMTGLSAGSFAAAALVTGTPLGPISEAWRHGPRHTARGRRVRAIDITERAFGDARDARVSGVSLRVPTMRRVLVDGGQHRLADVVAASSSPWGVARGHVVAGQPLYDAGMISNTAADLAPKADRLLVLAPLARGVLGRQGLLWESRLLREVTLWRARHHGSVEVVRPSPEVAAGGQTWSQIMDMSVAEQTYAAAFRQGRELADRLASAALQRAC